MNATVWTREFPETPGYYWLQTFCQDGSPWGKAEVVRVVQNKGGWLELETDPSDVELSLAEMQRNQHVSYEWQGPIAPKRAQTTRWSILIRLFDERGQPMPEYDKWLKRRGDYDEWGQEVEAIAQKHEQECPDGTVDWYEIYYDRDYTPDEDDAE